jgi:hypothetical protein
MDELVRGDDDHREDSHKAVDTQPADLVHAVLRASNE